MRFLLAVGTTKTAEIDGISAAGTTPAQMRHTPPADAEIVTYGTTVTAPVMPVSPAGCPTPAVVTRAVRELRDFAVASIDAGLAAPTAAPTISIDATPGGDVREPTPVAAAEQILESARALGQALPEDELVIGESIPGGTTTALGVLAALGEPYSVSSSLAENPLELKRAVVDDGLTASNIDRGESAMEPVRALRAMGDPVLATVTGLAHGGLTAGKSITLAGGTQMIAVAALLRHAGVEDDLRLATTPFVAADPSADIAPAAADLDLELTVTDPDVAETSNEILARYEAGEAKEGVGMGGALMLAEQANIPMETVRDRISSIARDLTANPPTHGS